MTAPPSKAALKRARKKTAIAARAQAAVTAATQDVGLSASGQQRQAAATSGSTSLKQQRETEAAVPGRQAAAAAGGTYLPETSAAAEVPRALHQQPNSASLAAAQDALSELQVADGATGLAIGAAPPGAEDWMLCPLSRVPSFPLASPCRLSLCPHDWLATGFIATQCAQTARSG